MNGELGGESHVLNPYWGAKSLKVVLKNYHLHGFHCIVFADRVGKLS